MGSARLLKVMLGVGEGSLCQAATGIIQINHLVTFFPNPHSFRTPPGSTPRTKVQHRQAFFARDGSLDFVNLGSRGGRVKVRVRVRINVKAEILRQHHKLYSIFPE